MIGLKKCCMCNIPIKSDKYKTFTGLFKKYPACDKCINSYNNYLSFFKAAKNKKEGKTVTVKKAINSYNKQSKVDVYNNELESHFQFNTPYTNPSKYSDENLDDLAIFSFSGLVLFIIWIYIKIHA